MLHQHQAPSCDILHQHQARRFNVLLGRYVKAYVCIYIYIYMNYSSIIAYIVVTAASPSQSVESFAGLRARASPV